MSYNSGSLNADTSYGGNTPAGDVEPEVHSDLSSSPVCCFSFSNPAKAWKTQERFAVAPRKVRLCIPGSYDLFHLMHIEAETHRGQPAANKSGEGLGWLGEA